MDIKGLNLEPVFTRPRELAKTPVDCMWEGPSVLLYGVTLYADKRVVGVVGTLRYTLECKDERVSLLLRTCGRRDWEV